MSHQRPKYKRDKLTVASVASRLCLKQRQKRPLPDADEEDEGGEVIFLLLFAAPVLLLLVVMVVAVLEADGVESSLALLPALLFSRRRCCCCSCSCCCRGLDLFSRLVLLLPINLSWLLVSLLRARPPHLCSQAMTTSRQVMTIVT